MACRDHAEEKAWRHLVSCQFRTFLQLRNRLENILTYCRHAIANGLAEGLNTKIKTIKRPACGLELYPP